MRCLWSRHCCLLAWPEQSPDRTNSLRVEKFSHFIFLLGRREENARRTQTHTPCDEENVVYSHHQIITATINYDQFVIYDFSLREKLLLAKCVYGEECVWIFSSCRIAWERDQSEEIEYKHTDDECVVGKVNSWSLVVRWLKMSGRFNVVMKGEWAKNFCSASRVREKCVIISNDLWAHHEVSSSFMWKISGFWFLLFAPSPLWLKTFLSSQRVFKISLVLFLCFLLAPWRTSRHRSSSWSRKYERKNEKKILPDA